ncbi:MAG: hypothetical protein WB523_18745 [Candidatus Sulfotelmatobacter sp.]
MTASIRILPKQWGSRLGLWDSGIPVTPPNDLGRMIGKPEVEAWQRSELTDVTAKMVIYEVAQSKPTFRTTPGRSF